MNILFIASVSLISAHQEANRKLFVDDIGLPLEDALHDGYWHSEKIAGAKHFGVWPLAQAARACFGSDQWPATHPVPQACIEFEVADADAVQASCEELKGKGYTLFHDARTEPWGQTVARLQTREGALIGISYAPWLHKA